MKYKMISLFSGAGGLDLGFMQTKKYKLLFANEILVSVAMTHAVNSKLKLEQCSDTSKLVQASAGTILACDIAKVDFNPLRDCGIDIVVGGPPCQDFSIVRGPSWDRRGIEVNRGRLYSHFVRALVSIQPKVFVFENVPGLITANNGLAYKVILEDFENLKLRWPEVKKAISSTEDGNNSIQGYEIIFSGKVDFSKLGVPQKRERLIIIGIRKDLIKNVQLLWDLRREVEKTLQGKKWLFWKYPLTTIETFEGKTLEELSSEYQEIMREWEGVWEEVGTEYARKWKEKIWDKLTFDIISDYKLVNNIKDDSDLEHALEQHEKILKELGYYGKPVSKLVLPDSTTSPPNDSKRVIERMKRIPPDENHEFVRGTKWEVEGRGISLVYRRIHPLKPSYTVVAYGGGGTHGYHYRRNRATLSLREKARLQTFPDDFEFKGKKSEIRAQIGEAVPPLAAKRIAELIADILGQLS